MITTGFAELDQSLGPIPYGTLWVHSGGVGSYKSQFAKRVGQNVGAAGLLYDHYDLERGYRTVAGGPPIDQGDLWDSSSIEETSGAASLVVIDPVHLLDLPNEAKLSEPEKLTELLVQLKSLARNCHLVLLALVQTNRMGLSEKLWTEGVIANNADLYTHSVKLHEGLAEIAAFKKLEGFKPAKIQVSFTSAA